MSRGIDQSTSEELRGANGYSKRPSRAIIPCVPSVLGQVGRGVSAVMEPTWHRWADKQPRDHDCFSECAKKGINRVMSE